MKKSKVTPFYLKIYNEKNLLEVDAKQPMLYFRYIEINAILKQKPLLKTLIGAKYANQQERLRYL